MINIEPTKMAPSSTPLKASDKDRVIWFLDHGLLLAVAPGDFRDRETGKLAGQLFLRKQDGYIWDSDTVYHFKKYDYPLPDEFVQYCVKNYRENMIKWLKDPLKEHRIAYGGI